MRFIGAPRQPEIDQYTIEFLVGAIALGLPIVEYVLTRATGDPIPSIGASFVVLGWFCVIFMRRARAKGHREANRRAAIYQATPASTAAAAS